MFCLSIRAPRSPPDRSRCAGLSRRGRLPAQTGRKYLPSARRPSSMPSNVEPPARIDAQSRNKQALALTYRHGPARHCRARAAGACGWPASGSTRRTFGPHRTVAQSTPSRSSRIGRRRRDEDRRAAPGESLEREVFAGRARTSRFSAHGGKTASSCGSPTRRAAARRR